MVQSQQTYSDLFEIVQPPVAELDGMVTSVEFNVIGIMQLPVAELPSDVSSLAPFAKLPWSHNVVLMQQVKNLETRIW